MATMNPFDLLGDDDNDDPEQLLQKIVAAPPKKAPAPAPAQPAKPAPKLPSKPLPPAQAGHTERDSTSGLWSSGSARATSDKVAIRNPYFLKIVDYVAKEGHFATCRLKLNDYQEAIMFKRGYCQDEMMDMMDISNEIQESLGRSCSVADDIDEDELLGELDALEADMGQETESEGVPSYLQPDNEPDLNEELNLPSEMILHFQKKNKMLLLYLMTLIKELKHSMRTRGPNISVIDTQLENTKMKDG
ncbi:hypothetical protein M8C21_001807, partial [Ambrosia artemisiifolia]